MISTTLGKECGFGDYSVTEIDHVLIEMPDGIKLSSKIWFPSSSIEDSGYDAKHKLFYKAEKEKDIKNEKFPVILEYLPYRKADFTAPRDFRRHSWFSSHGYVSLRVDMRGCGDSEGLYYDEYLKQEQDDCINVMKWVSAQAWSNKNVGMYGKSWGGFNGLQLAYLQPPELKTAISLYSTDDRYRTDINHDGGCIIGDGLLSWASCMFPWNARAPDPRNCKNWKEIWQERLNKSSAPWSRKWLKEQLRNEYWSHGSICEDYSKMTCPILAIGGWMDGYRDAVFRMVENLPNVKGIIGPWPHEWPDTCKPGPNMDYLKVCLQWFDHHLKGVQNDVMNEPKLRVYEQLHVKPDPLSEFRPGTWLGLDGWPTKQVDEQVFYAENSTRLLKETESLDNKWCQVPFALQSGMFQGIWLVFAGPFGPSDQSFANDLGLAFSTGELNENISLIGQSSLECRVKVMNHDQGCLAVRLSHVFPTGESTFITYGMLNLTHRNGHSQKEVKSLVVGEEIDIRVDLHSMSYVIPKGHSLKLCISSAYFPRMWPSSKKTEILITNIKLKLPIIPDNKRVTYRNPLFITTNPAVGPDIPQKILNSMEESMKFEMDQSGKTCKMIIKTGRPKTLMKPLNTMVGEEAVETYEVSQDCPLSAKATCIHDYIQEYPDFEGGLSFRVFTESIMHADESKFYLTNTLKTWSNGELFFEKEWKDEIDRLYT